MSTILDSRQLHDLHELIDWSRSHSSRIGYFAALYTHVGEALDAALKNGAFEHPQRIDALNDVFFARYLAACDAYRDHEAPSAVWAVALQATRNPRLCVLQHLMLGMNAHINFDLAVAVAAAIAPADLPGFRADFDRMNALLASLVNGIAADMAIAWPLLRTINRLFRSEDDVIIDFSMSVAREAAWQAALRLSRLEGDALARAITELDAEATRLAGIVARPASPADLITFVIRCGERGTVAQIIDDLLQP